MITIKTDEEIEQLREGGKILAFVLDEISKMAEPGVSLMDLEKKSRELIRASNAEPSFLGYKDYPAALCASLDEEVVHCIPSDRILEEGQILSLDCGVKFKGLFTDSARTIPIGKVSQEAEDLIKVTKNALDVAIAAARPKATIGDISAAIQNYVEPKGYSVVKSLVGHGVGHAVHEDPRIPNYGEAGTGEVLKTGMVLAFEPMVNIGESQVVFHDDGWRVTTQDKSLSAHFEHTIAITKKGSEVLTK
ncbi:MAG: type I methionyl aminopeptidase [Patescibacteria group bacterium]